MMDDYYSTLGVSKTATDDEIKKAYRNLAFKYHPDRNSGDKGAEEQFKKISAAYSVLGDPSKRAQYDSGASNAFEQGGAYGYNPFGGFYRGYNSGARTGTNNESYDPFQEWADFSNSSRRTYYTYSSNDSYKENLSRSQALGLIINKGIIAFLGFASLRLSIWFFPIGPLLSFAAIINGVAGVGRGLRALFSAKG